jgi:hypothetical protein
MYGREYLRRFRQGRSFCSVDRSSVTTRSRPETTFAMPIGLWLDRLILLWIMPPLGFLITVLQIPALGYLKANYVVAALLGFGLVVSFLAKKHSLRTIVYAVSAAILAFMFTSIEWLHFVEGKYPLDGLSDIRMILYSPLYGSVIIFSLYSVYLTLLDERQRLGHVTFFLKFMSLFIFLFQTYWFLLYFEWVDAIPRADLLHSNSISYAALFLLVVIFFYGGRLKLDRYTILLLAFVNIPAIFVNGTRGAIIGFAAVLLFLVNKGLGRIRGAVAIRLAIGAVAAMVVLIALQSGMVLTGILGSDSGAMNVLFDQVYNAYQDGSHLVSIDTSLVSDESTISAFSRIGSNYYSFLSFLDNFLLGIGQTEAYSIDVLGSGVHSFHFLAALATGVVGMILLYTSILLIILAQRPKVLRLEFFVIFFICFFYSLIFVNDIAVYLALLITVIVRWSDVKDDLSVESRGASSSHASRVTAYAQ